MDAITITCLSKAFGSHLVLDQFSATLPLGRMTGLTSPSGGGKTTLLRILMGLERADSGSIQGLQGLCVRSVFQEDRLCDYLDPVGNIRLVHPSCPTSEIQQAVAAVGLTSCVGQPVSQLSGGMRRRVAILRGILSPCDLLLLDEPFRGLDHLTRALVIQYLLQHTQGKTLLLVTHDFQELTLCGVTHVITLPPPRDFIPTGSEESTGGGPPSANSHQDIM